jgi:signal transduction histidine kinase
VYALSKNGHAAEVEPGKSARTAIVLTILCVGAVVAVSAWLVTAQVGHLPVFYDGSVLRQTSLGNQVNVGLLFWYGAALVVLLLLRRRTILDLWLIVILAAWMPNFLVAALASSVRFSLGWYAARGFALVASFMLLIVLLTEMTVLYSRLANAFSLLRRERANRMMSVDAATAAIAHEVRSPLGAIALNATTGLAQIRSSPPTLGEMDEILSDIKADSQRADEIISSVRALFKTAIYNQTPAELGGIARRALSLSEPDLLANSISVTTEFSDHQVQVRADQVQLQQVIINLIRNAIEAMHSSVHGSRRLRLATKVNGSSVSLSIEDTGTGISPGDHDRIFETFVTTKSSGMGLGLAISRRIVERHGGTLRVAGSGPDGSIFELALPRG